MTRQTKADLRSEIDYLKSKVSAYRQIIQDFATHKPGCYATKEADGHTCTCGLKVAWGGNI